MIAHGWNPHDWLLLFVGVAGLLLFLFFLLAFLYVWAERIDKRDKNDT